MLYMYGSTSSSSEEHDAGIEVDYELRPRANIPRIAVLARVIDVESKLGKRCVRF